MSRLLEILGRAITVDTADLIWNWLGSVKFGGDQGDSCRYQQLDKVIELVGQRKTDSAQKQLQLYLSDNPSCIYGRLAAAAICLSNCRLQDAVEQLSSVYTRQPNNTLALYALAHCYERLGKEQEAVEFYQDCLKFKGYLLPPRQRLAAIYFKNSQLDKTITEYELLRDEYPDDIAALVTLGHLYIAGSAYESAVETFNTAILIHPDNFHSDNTDIDQLIREGRLHNAIETLEEMLQQQPERADLAVKRADILAMMGAAEQAIEQYQEAVGICPDFLEATIKLGTQYLQTNEDQLAAMQFNRAVEINDRIVEAYIGLATAQKLAGNISDAVGTLSLAAAIQPNSSLLLAETATLQFKNRIDADYHCQCAPVPDALITAVIQSHQQQTSRHPQNPDLHYRLGVLLMSIGRITDAIDALQAALHINPTHTRARSKLAVCLFETGQRESALEQMLESDCLDKETLELHYKTALLYCDKLRFASSLINLERRLESNFTSPDATVNISIVLQNLGLLDRAAAMWDNLSDTTAQAAGPNHPFSPDSR